MIKKEDFDLEDFDQELSDCLERMGFNEETKQKCADLFYDAIEQRLFHQDDEFRQNLAELLNDYTPNPFIVLDERIDVVQMLANRIQELEN